LQANPAPAVLQVVPTLDTGGAERTTIDISRAIVKGGLRSIVATEGGRLEPLFTATGGKIVHLPVNSKAPHTILANALRLARLIRKLHVNIVHARSRAPAWSASLAAEVEKVPFVTTYHGIYNASNLFKRFYNSVMVRSDAVIANSQWTATHIVNEHGISRERIHVIPRGVDLLEFDPAGVSPERIDTLRANWRSTANDLVIMLPGRLTRWKGQLVFVKALAQLSQLFEPNRMRAVLVGDAQGRDDYVAELRTAISEAVLGERVVLAGHVADMPAAYLASDIVVSASTDPEGFGRVAAEAAAMGRPVIATDHGGARETVVPGVTGLLAPPGDPAALASAIRKLVEMGPTQRSQMGEAGRKHVRENFSLARMCDSTINLYRQLLA